MSAFEKTPNIDDYINRGLEMLDNNNLLINIIEPKDSLVTKILAQEPPIEQAPNNTIMPVIFVAYSQNPISTATNIGRASLDVAAPKYYPLEFYNVIIVRGISKQAAQIKAQRISEIVRDTYQKNTRMTFPFGSNPIAADNEVIAVPRIIRSSDPNIQSINVIVRPKVPIQL